MNLSQAVLLHIGKEIRFSLVYSRLFMKVFSLRRKYICTLLDYGFKPLPVMDTRGFGIYGSLICTSSVILKYNILLLLFFLNGSSFICFGLCGELKYILNLLVTTPICNTPKPYRMGDRGTYILIPNPSDY